MTSLTITLSQGNARSVGTGVPFFAAHFCGLTTLATFDSRRYNSFRMKPYSFIVLAAAACATLVGCVERRITLVTDPPNALVYLNNVEVGRSPVTVPFQWYGDYDVRARLDRDEGTPEKPKPVHYIFKGNRKTETPWFQWLGVDLFAEISPFTFKDEQIWALTLAPQPDKTDAQLVENAKVLRSQLEVPNPIEPKKDEKKNGKLKK